MRTSKLIVSFLTTANLFLVGTSIASAAKAVSVEREGSLQVMHVHNVDKTSGYRYFLDSKKGRTELKFTSGSAAPKGRSGDKIRVKGKLSGNVLALDSTDSGSYQVLAVDDSGPVYGEQRTLVMMVNFQDNQTQFITPTEVSNVIFGTTSDFFKEASYGQTWLSGKVFGWHTLPINQTCETHILESSANQAATESGIDLSLYPRRIYIIPRNTACSWSFLGSVGGAMGISSSDIMGAVRADIIGHEMGHNFGLWHSNALECGAVALGSSCAHREYGDWFDTMGGGSDFLHFNAVQKENLGWINYGSAPPIVTLESGGGTYTLEPYALNGRGTKALKLLQSIDQTKGTKSWYYVEFRQPIGFDSPLSGDPGVINGVLIHRGRNFLGNSNESHLLDMTPASSSNMDWWDPALGVGKSYVDSESGLTISVLSVSASGATVSVNMGGPTPTCVLADPTLTIAPVVNRVVAPGETAPYTLTVRNNNSPACSRRQFNVEVSLPAGWSTYPSSSGVTLNSGDSYSLPFSITSPTSVAAGNYTFTGTANFDLFLSTVHKTTSTGTYTVGSGTTCSRVNPKITLTLVGGSYNPGTAVNYGLTVTNNDGYGCGDSIFNLSHILPSGWIASFANPSLKISTGASASTTLTVTSSSTATPGSNTFTAIATNSSAPTYTASASQVYFVATTCSRAYPTVSLIPSTSSSVAPGTSVSYTVSVKNNDSSYCSSSIFSLSKIVPSGWSSSLAISALSLSAGSIGSTTLTLTSPTTATSGTYNLSATATNNSATAYTGSASASYSVASVATCSRANPSVTMSPATSASVAPGTAVSYSISVKNNDSSGCSSSSFNLSRTVPSGWSSSLSSSSLSLSPGGSASATLTVTSATTAAAGTYSISASAVNSSATSYGGNASASYSVASVASLSASVVTNKVTYLKGDSVLVTASVSSGGVAISGVSVSFAITKPDGSVVNASAVTDTSGRAVYKLRLNRKAPLGTYQIRVNAVSGGQSASAVNSFSVQ